ncbi:glycosyltransferase family 2 protein [Sphingomonas sp. AX6]|uniref:glycosyltransferase family 2 protein n=1 Tax=Sphingomonas sp. AX6 TaxID=2653171 RepID=UPI0012F0BBC9|nr:glycosyltransferase family 2 protein [Sphingomonas sp. AX6]VXC98779.1 conserved membrane hypothetical protein [Sphingomonas sp. AX6]
MPNLIAWIVASIAAVPVLMLALECFVGSHAAAVSPPAKDGPPFTVLMPAHNEERGIEDSIRAVRAQMRSRDQLIVIADNCSDGTASIARSLGATVTERVDPDRRGKGYALEAARPYVAQGRRRAIIVVDADCIPDRHALRQLAATAVNEDAAVQAIDLLSVPAKATPLVRISCFAFLVKNLVRQRALKRLADVALLQGTGMAFPQALYARIDWGGGSLVEDLDLGIRLLIGGERVLFEDRAAFFSPASSQAATVGQRRRWEHGMLDGMARNVPRLIVAGLRQRPALLIVAADQIIPPTVMLIAAVTSLWLTMWVIGLFGPALLLTGALALLVLGLGVAWSKCGREIVPFDMLGQSIRYFAWKLPIALQFITRREGRWVRTERKP